VWIGLRCFISSVAQSQSHFLSNIYNKIAVWFPLAPEDPIRPLSATLTWWSTWSRRSVEIMWQKIPPFQTIIDFIPNIRKLFLQVDVNSTEVWDLGIPYGSWDPVECFDKLWRIYRDFFRKSLTIRCRFAFWIEDARNCERAVATGWVNGDQIYGALRYGLFESTPEFQSVRQFSAKMRDNHRPKLLSNELTELWPIQISTLESSRKNRTRAHIKPDGIVSGVNGRGDPMNTGDLGKADEFDTEQTYLEISGWRPHR